VTIPVQDIATDTPIEEDQFFVDGDGSFQASGTDAFLELRQQ
jgi:hypothetical protein